MNFKRHAPTCRHVKAEGWTGAHAARIPARLSAPRTHTRTRRPFSTTAAATPSSGSQYTAGSSSSTDAEGAHGQGSMQGSMQGPMQGSMQRRRVVTSPWRGAAWALLSGAQGRMAALPPSLLLLLTQLCGSAGIRLTNTQAQELCSAWQRQLDTTRPQQCVQLLGCLVDVRPEPPQGGPTGANATATTATTTTTTTTTSSAAAGGIDAAWLDDIHEHVAQSAHQLSVADVLSFLAATQQLGSLQRHTLSRILRSLAHDHEGQETAAQSDMQSSSSSTAPPGPTLRSGMTSDQAARLLVQLGRLKAVTTEPEVVSALVSKVHAAAEQLAPLTVLCAYQYVSACKLVLPALKAAPIGDVVLALSAASSYALHLPLMQPPPHGPRGPNTPTDTTTITPQLWAGASVAARQALQQLVAVAVGRLQPEVRQLVPGQLVAVAEALHRSGFQEPLHPAPGMGQGTHNSQMVNSMPVTIIHPPTPPNSPNNSQKNPSTQQGQGEEVSPQADGAASGNATQQRGDGGMGGDGPQQGRAGSAGQQQGGAGVLGGPNGLCQALHAACMQQLHAFQDGEQVADLLRPLAAMRALPSRTLLSQLATAVEQSGRAHAEAARQLQQQPWHQPPAAGSSQRTPEGGMSHHAVCMALFLFSVLGYAPGRSVLEAAQTQLGPCMSALPAGDLTNAIWAFACLDRVAAAGAGAGTGRDSSAGSGAAGATAAATAAGSIPAGGRTPVAEAATSAAGVAGTESGGAAGARAGAPRSRTLADIAASNTAKANAAGQASGGPATDPDRPAPGAPVPATNGNGVRGGAAGPRSTPAWLVPALRAVGERVEEGGLAPHQLAFVLGSLERAGAPLPPSFVDKVLTGFQAQLPVSTTGDAVLVLASVARLGHVTSYTWMDEVVEAWMMPRLAGFTPKELATVGWSLARLHHRPSPDFLISLVDALEPNLAIATADNLATFLWALAELAPDAPVTLFLDALCEELRPRLSELMPRDLVSLLSAMARLRYQPPADWLSEWLRVFDCHLAFIDSEGYSQVVSSLAVLDARVTSTTWWTRFMGQMCRALPSMDTESLLVLAAGLVCLKVVPPEPWKKAFTQAVERRCGVSSREWGSNQQQQQQLTAAQHELLLASQLPLDVRPGPRQVADLEAQLAGLGALRALGPERLVRLVGSLAAAAAAGTASGVAAPGTQGAAGATGSAAASAAAAVGAGGEGLAPLPRSAWLGGPLAEALRAVLPDLPVLKQSQLAKVLGQLVSALDARAAADLQGITTTTTTTTTTAHDPPPAGDSPPPAAGPAAAATTAMTGDPSAPPPAAAPGAVGNPATAAAAAAGAGDNAAAAAAAAAEAGAGAKAAAAAAGAGDKAAAAAGDSAVAGDARLRSGLSRGRDVQQQQQFTRQQAERAPAELRNLLAYLREFYLYGG